MWKNILQWGIYSVIFAIFLFPIIGLGVNLLVSIPLGLFAGLLNEIRKELMIIRKRLEKD